MSDGYPTAAQKEALRLICDHNGLRVDQVAGHLIAARDGDDHPGYNQAIARMAGTLLWRLQAQGFITESTGTPADTWVTTRSGRTLISCSN